MGGDEQVGERWMGSRTGILKLSRAVDVQGRTRRRNDEMRLERGARKLDNWEVHAIRPLILSHVRGIQSVEAALLCLQCFEGSDT
jgi:hypothetical protein